MTTVALRRVTPADAASASAVINTTRQLGAVLGAAVIGAVLQNRLATDLNSRASAAAAVRLPRPLQAEFTARFAEAVKQGLHVGRGQDGVQVPTGLPPEVAHQLRALVHDVFVNGFVAGMRPTVMVAVAVLGVASVSCLLIKGRRTVETVDTAQAAVGWPSQAPSEEGA
jgi:hypothetical protein